MASILLDNVSVEFPLYQGGSRSLKKNLFRMGSGGRFARDAADRIYVKALDNLSLHFKRGDRVGLVGPNGAGKTTLLRVLAGVYEPVRGHIEVTGEVTPMFDLSLGMDMDVTGYDNIMLRGLMIGLSHAEIRSKAAEIVEFTELGPYIDMPIRTYSSGMMLRLAFAISTCISPEILLMDEWVLAGDAHFMERAEKRLAHFVSQSSVLVLASHNSQLIRHWCNRAVLMERGEAIMVGDVEPVMAFYASRQ